MKNRHLKLVIIFIFISITSIVAQKHHYSVIFNGDYPDPAVVKDGGNYYMTTSPMSSGYPNIIVWHSTDLFNWQRIGCALNEDLGGDLWAVDFVKYGDLFYIYIPAVSKDRGIYVVTAKNPAGPWSEPKRMEGISGIDPGHIATPEGKRYLFVDNGHVAELSADGLSVIGKERKVYDGWKFGNDFGVECFCLESPKLFYRDGYYYLTSAQGGTAGPSTSHMAVVARSKSVFGPFEDSPYNPLIKTYSPYERWRSKGHATLIEGPDSQWYAFYHGIEDGNIPAGRKTLMEPIVWTKEGWPKSLLKDDKKSKSYFYAENTRPQNDDFSSNKLSLSWILNDYETYIGSQLENGVFKLKCNKDDLSYFTQKPADRDFDVSVKIKVDKGVEAGFVMLYDKKYYAGLTIKNGYLQGTFKDGRSMGDAINDTKAEYYKLSMRNYNLYISYSSDGKYWESYPTAYDLSGYHCNILDNFGSLKIAVIGKGAGYVSVDDFVYTPYSAVK